MIFLYYSKSDNQSDTIKRKNMAKNVVYYQKGESIIKEGKSGKRMYIIIEGTVDIVLTDGKDKITVATLKKGDFFGEMSIFTDNPRSASAYANEALKLAYIDDEKHLKKFLEINPGFSSKMIHVLAMRLAATNKLLLEEFKEVNNIKYLREMTSYHFYNE
jgi:CRP/FNR family transcriptional regulator, cyclic AMP receptor protein